MRLADYMRKHGLRDEDLAAKVSRNRATVNRWRNGKLRPDWKALQRIAEVTKGKVSPEDFFVLLPDPRPRGRPRLQPTAASE